MWDFFPITDCIWPGKKIVLAQLGGIKYTIG